MGLFTSVYIFFLFRCAKIHIKGDIVLTIINYLCNDKKNV
ncbi:hypothetical protein HMPREF3202_02389 [Prevotella bivia]|uniref:Uncharacterized protein n=1 Tax=Prevotella bivia TaxID=28125 RepID=A0A137SQG5_9BACT|nr:hypothetical protein HMPREF3202_02389 [Prevotella bivia]